MSEAPDCLNCFAHPHFPWQCNLHFKLVPGRNCPYVHLDVLAQKCNAVQASNDALMEQKDELRTEIARRGASIQTQDRQLAAKDAELERLRAENAKARKYINNIANQNLEHEMPEEDRDDADYEGAYESIVRDARATRAALNEGGE